MNSTPAQQTHIYVARLKSRLAVAERTMALSFEKPPGMTYRAGQFVELTLINPAEMDAAGSTRAFSIASAPHEDTLLFVTRMRDTAFKRALGSMRPEAEVRLEGPFGNFTLHNNSARPAVFLAGGIGITPFRSIALRAAREKLSHRIFLFYSNRCPEDGPFLAELEALERQNANFRLIATMTQMGLSTRPWRGETGLINKDMLARYLTGVRSPVYYVAGPPAMVIGFRKILNSLGVDDDDIRGEEFAGY